MITRNLRILCIVQALALTPARSVLCDDTHKQQNGSPAEESPPELIHEPLLLRQRAPQYEQQLLTLQQQVAPTDADEPALSSSQFVNFNNDVSASALEVDESGLKIEEVEIQKKPSHKLRGRLYFDHVMFDDDDVLGINRLNETGFDTARLGMSGNIFENVGYQIEVEFEGTEVDFKSTFIELQKIPFLGNFRAGHYYEPIAGLEEDSGSRYQMFMERALSIPAFVPSRSFGYMFHNTSEDENLYWAVGTFRHESDDSPPGRGTIIGDAGDWTFTQRVAWNPYYDEETDGRYLVHVGLGHSYRTDSTMVAFRTVSELGNQAGFLATTIPGDRDYSVIVPEFLVIWGPLSVQSEFAFAPTGNGNFWGGYVEASYFLTGGNRGYSRKGKHITTPNIIENFFSIRSPLGLVLGKGGWEVKSRWSHVDMRDGTGPRRGLQNNYSTGVNWYWNKYTRVMFEYVYEDISMVALDDGTAQSFGTRMQVHW